MALHPIDVFSAASGALLVALRDPVCLGPKIDPSFPLPAPCGLLTRVPPALQNVQTIQPVVAVHASEQLIAAGTSTNLVVYEPTPPDDDGDAAAVAEAADAAGAAAAAALRRQQQRAAFKPRTLHAGGKGGKGGRDDDDDEDDDDAPKKKGKGKGKGKAV